MSDIDENQKQSKKTKGVGRGGPRPRSGRPKGRVSAKTLEIQEAAKRYADDALSALVDVALNGRSEGARVAAASALLDRGYGRPRQAIEHTGNVGASGVMIVPEAPDPETWAREVAARQAALAGVVPLQSTDEAA
jgi:hypothetical protein